MKAISIRQPWAHAILHFGKRIENRGWKTDYRGPILLHASGTLTKREYQEFAMFWEKFPRRPLQTYPLLPPMASLPRGGFVGVADLVDVIDEMDTPPEGQRPWFFGHFGFVLDNVRPIPFRPYRGELSIFNVRDDTIERQLAVSS